jgi:hypothetical protein
MSGVVHKNHNGVTYWIRSSVHFFFPSHWRHHFIIRWRRCFRIYKHARVSCTLARQAAKADSSSYTRWITYIYPTMYIFNVIKFSSWLTPFTIGMSIVCDICRLVDDRVVVRPKSGTPANPPMKFRGNQSYAKFFNCFFPYIHCLLIIVACFSLFEYSVAF